MEAVYPRGNRLRRLYPFQFHIEILGGDLQQSTVSESQGLEEDQLICRFTDPEKKQHVEYRLSENGKKIMPVIKSIYKYSIDDMIEKDILIDSRAFDYYNPVRRTSEEKTADQTPEEDQIPEEKEERGLSQKKTDTMTA